MKLRSFILDDLNEVTKMFIALINIIYPKHQKGKYEEFLQTVKYWIISKKDLFVIEHEGEIIAFSLSYIEKYGFIEPFYYGDLLYVKEQWRGSRAAFLLYANIIQIAEKKLLPIHAKGFTENDASKILQKILGTPTFIEFIRV